MPEDFAPLDAQAADRCGPPAVLLTGHSSPEAALLRRLLGALQLPDHPVVCCTLPMLGQPLQRALESAQDMPQQDTPIPAERLPRVVVLSGLSGPEVHRLLDAYRALQIPRPILATTTPANLCMSVRDLLRHLLAEHAAMQQLRQEAEPAAPSQDGDSSV